MRWFNPWWWRYTFFLIKWNAMRDAKLGLGQQAGQLSGYVKTLNGVMHEQAGELVKRWLRRHGALIKKMAFRHLKYESSKDKSKQVQNEIDAHTTFIGTLDNQASNYAHDINPTSFGWKSIWVIIAGCEIPFNIFVMTILGDNLLVTIGLGLGLALLIIAMAHFQGMVLKQEWVPLRRLWIFGILILFLLLIGAVAGLRIYLVESQGVPAALGLTIPHGLLIIFFFIFNLMIYVFGVYLAYERYARYAEHDRILKNIKKSRKKLNSQKKYQARLRKNYEKNHRVYSQLQNEIKANYRNAKAKVELLYVNMAHRYELYQATFQRYFKNDDFKLVWPELDTSLPEAFKKDESDLLTDGDMT